MTVLREITRAESLALFPDAAPAPVPTRPWVPSRRIPLFVCGPDLLTDGPIADLGELRQPGVTWTYFIVSGGMIKIGKTLDPAARLQGFATGLPSPVGVLAIAKGDIEKRSHQIFMRSRHHGEWFAPSRELIDYAIASGSVDLRGSKLCGS